MTCHGELFAWSKVLYFRVDQAVATPNLKNLQYISYVFEGSVEHLHTMTVRLINSVTTTTTNGVTRPAE